jgi:hypothetical protein
VAESVQPQAGMEERHRPLLHSIPTSIARAEQWWITTTSANLSSGHHEVGGWAADRTLLFGPTEVPQPAHGTELIVPTLLRKQ